MQSAMDLWQRNLSELEQKYRITNKILLAKSSIVLLVVILLFFLSNTIPNVELDLGKPPYNEQIKLIPGFYCHDNNTSACKLDQLFFLLLTTFYSNFEAQHLHDLSC